MKHTPGPWKIEIGSAHAMIRAKHGEVENQTIAQVWLQDTEYTPANANLIAAAPDLLVALEALELAIGMGIDADPKFFREAHKLATHALAKAKGV